MVRAFYYLALLGLSSQLAVKSQFTPKPVVCYYSSWARYRQGDGAFVPSDIDPTLCTHAIYAFSAMDATTYEIISADPWADLPSTEPGGGLDGYGDMVRLKNINSDLKVLLSQGGYNAGSASYSQMASDPSSRASFVQSVVPYLKKYNFDGLDMYWEYPGSGLGSSFDDKGNYVLLMQELKDAFEGENLLLSSAMGVTKGVIENGYDFVNLCPHVDFFNVPMFDLQGPWDGITGHHTGMYDDPNMGDLAYSVASAVDVIASAEGCIEKMMLGMAMYGKTYTLSDPTQTDIGSPISGTGNACTYTGENGLCAYYEICSKYGSQSDRDEYTLAPWSYQADQWVCYDDVQSVHVKSNYLIENGFMGAMVWSIEEDDSRNLCGLGSFPLLNKIHEIMTNGPSEIATTTAGTMEPATTAEETTDSGSYPTVPSDPEKIIVCYFQSWAIYRYDKGSFFVDDINPTLCTHAIYAIALLDGTTNQMVVADPWADFGSSGGGNYDGYNKFNAMKNVNPNLKTMIAIGGWNEGSEKYSDMAASESTRATFINSAVNFVKTYGFDGLDLEWEYPGSRTGSRVEDKQNLVSLVKELRSAFDREGLILSIAVGVQEDTLDRGYDFVGLCPYLDFINLNTFDLNTYSEGFAAHHTSQYSHPDLSDNSLDKTLTDIIARSGCLDKMVLGIASYGGTDTLTDPSQNGIGAPVTGPGSAGPYTQSPGFLAYYEICALSDYTESMDQYTLAPWTSKDDQWISYDSTDSVILKIQWALSNGLKGGMLYSVDEDDFLNTCGGGPFPLLSTLHDIVISYSVKDSHN